MTPEAKGDELVGFLRAPDPEAEFELRGDPGVVRSILDATRHIALVDMAGATNVPVPYGVGRPVVGRQYLVESTPRGDRWIKSAGIPWCKTWTLNDDFNEGGAEFVGDMLDPAMRDRLEVYTFSPFGDGADGAAVHNLNGGDVDLNNASICGRATPDAAWDTVDSWSLDNLNGQPAGKIGPTHGIPAGIVAGDEVLIYVAQVKSTGGDALTSLVGYWEAHRVVLIAGGFIWYDDYIRAAPTQIGDTITYVQRIPNYTTISQTGSLNVSAITCGYHDATSAEAGTTPPAGAGTGVVFVRASVSSAARYTAIAKGFEGGANGEHCEDLGADGYWEHSNPGHGKRVPNGSDGDGGNGKFGGGSAGGNGHCLTGPLNTAHVAAFGHNAGHPSTGGGGGHATAGETPTTNTQHSTGGGGFHYAGRPEGAGGIAIGQSALMNPAAFYGSAVFGGGGGSAGDYFLVSNNPGGPGGDGGGFVAVFAKSLQSNGASGFTIPTVDVNGSDGGFLAGGGAAGSILAYAETMGSPLGLDPWFMAEVVTIVGANTGWSGIGGASVGNAELATASPGRGAKGRVQIHYESTNNGYTANGSVNETSGALTYAGSWGSDIYESEMLVDVDDELPLDGGLLLEPTTLRANWTLDSDGTPPLFWLIGGDEPDLSDGVTYPVEAPAFWADGTAHDIGNGVELDLSPYVLAPALYWQVWASLDGGADTTDTPTVLEIELCGVAQ